MKHAAVALDYEQRIASLEADRDADAARIAALEAAVLDLLAMHKALQRANNEMFGALIVRGIEEEAGEIGEDCE